MGILGGARLDWGGWFYALIAATIGGGAGAVVSGVAVSMMDPKDFSFGSSKFFALVGTIFLTHAVIAGFMFLKQNPLPQIKTVTKVETTTLGDNPPAIVKTTVEETKVGLGSDVNK